MSGVSFGPNSFSDVDLLMMLLPYPLNNSEHIVLFEIFFLFTVLSVTVTERYTGWAKLSDTTLHFWL